MAYLVKNPLIANKVNTNPPSTPAGMRGIFPKDDGWYDIDENGEVKKIPFDGESGGSVEVDDTLSKSGAAADSKVTGDKLAEKANLKTENGGFEAGLSAHVNKAGAAIGKAALSGDGGAVGALTNAVDGFSGGYNAKSLGDGIQLGEGANTSEHTMQVYDFRLLNSDGTIPNERIPELANKEDKSNKVTELSDTSTDTQYPSAKSVYDELKMKADKQNMFGGFVGGENASASNGAAIGYGAETITGFSGGFNAESVTGAAVGVDTVAGAGFSGGRGAKAYMKLGDEIPIDTIQLGTGTNSKEKTLQVYDHTVMEADGTLPYVHTARPHIKTENAQTLELNTIYDLGVQTNLTLTLPSANYGNFIQVDFISGDTAPTLTISASSSALISDYDFIPESNKIYSLFFDYGRLDATNYGWRFSYAEYSYTPESEG